MQGRLLFRQHAYRETVYSESTTILVDKVDTEEVKNKTSEDVVGKCPVPGLACDITPYTTKAAGANLSCDMVPNSALFSGLVWILKLAVSTNWPTVAAKPERNALKGCSTSVTSEFYMGAFLEKKGRT